MENNPYNMRNLPQIMRSARKAAGLSQYQIGKLIGGKDQRYVQMLKMDLPSSLQSYVSSGLRSVMPMNILILSITYLNFIPQPLLLLIRHLMNVQVMR